MYIDRPFTMNLPLSSAVPVAVTVGLAVAVVGIAVAVGGISVALMGSAAVALVGWLVGAGVGVTAGVQALRAIANNNTAMISFRLFIFSPPLMICVGWLGQRLHRSTLPPKISDISRQRDK